MTGTTESNAISGIGVFLHVVNVMNRFAALATNCAGILIAPPDHAFECIIERWRIWLKGRTAIPERMILALFIDAITFVRAKSIVVASGPRKFLNKFLAAIVANEFYSFHSCLIMTLPRTIFAAFIAWVNKESFSAMKANLGFGPAFPPRRSVSFKFMRRMTGFGAILSRFFSARMNLKSLAAMFTSLFNHIISKRCTPYAARAFTHVARA